MCVQCYRRKSNATILPFLSHECRTVVCPVWCVRLNKWLVSFLCCRKISLKSRTKGLLQYVVSSLCKLQFSFFIGEKKRNLLLTPCARLHFSKENRNKQLWEKRRICRFEFKSIAPILVHIAKMDLSQFNDKQLAILKQVNSSLLCNCQDVNTEIRVWKTKEFLGE